jgi:hypothetical protein
MPPPAPARENAAHRSRDDAEGKTDKTGDKGRGKRPEGEQREIKCVKSVHGLPRVGPARARTAGNEATLGRPKWLRGGCLDLRSSWDRAAPEGNLALGKIWGLSAPT